MGYILEEFLEKYKGNRMFLATTKGGKNYCQYAYEDGDMILFGAESRGLPEKFIEANKAMAIRIPMSGAAEFRSLNLANCANIILFEALRQNGFQRKLNTVRKSKRNFNKYLVKLTCFLRREKWRLKLVSVDLDVLVGW